MRSGRGAVWWAAYRERGERLIHTLAPLAIARRLVDVLWALLRDRGEFTTHNQFPRNRLRQRVTADAWPGRRCRRSGRPRRFEVGIVDRGEGQILAAASRGIGSRSQMRAAPASLRRQARLG
jgi:hypothetical protein